MEVSLASRPKARQGKAGQQGQKMDIKAVRCQQEGARQSWMQVSTVVCRWCGVVSKPSLIQIATDGGCHRRPQQDKAGQQGHTTRQCIAAQRHQSKALQRSSPVVPVPESSSSPKLILRKWSKTRLKSNKAQDLASDGHCDAPKVTRKAMAVLVKCKCWFPGRSW